MKLDPYEPWTPATPPEDPRTASTTSIASSIEQMVTAEGPMLLSLVIRRYISSTPDLSRAGGAIRATFRKAVTQLASGDSIVVENEFGIDDEDHIVLRHHEATVVPRQRGDRTFHEIPLSEIGAMLMLVRIARGVSNYTETVQRGALVALELKRLTGATKDRMLVGWRVCERWVSEGVTNGRSVKVEVRPLPDAPQARKERPAVQADPDVPAWQAAMQGKPFTTRKS